MQVTGIIGSSLTWRLMAYQPEGHRLSFRLGTAEEHDPVDIVVGQGLAHARTHTHTHTHMRTCTRTHQ